ncbi:hypothetical protein KJZ61_00715 [Candidatus Dependentiae bacterium]|nr:hypothetical protein [Candidatus Dependentiae bacterium]
MQRVSYYLALTLACSILHHQLHAMAPESVTLKEKLEKFTRQERHNFTDLYKEFSDERSYQKAIQPIIDQWERDTNNVALQLRARKKYYCAIQMALYGVSFVVGYCYGNDLHTHAEENPYSFDELPINGYALSCVSFFLNFFLTMDAIRVVDHKNCSSSNGETYPDFQFPLNRLIFQTLFGKNQSPQKQLVFARLSLSIPDFVKKLADQNHQCCACYRSHLDESKPTFPIPLPCCKKQYMCQECLTEWQTRPESSCPTCRNVDVFKQYSADDQTLALQCVTPLYQAALDAKRTISGGTMPDIAAYSTDQKIIFTNILRQEHKTTLIQDLIQSGRIDKRLVTAHNPLFNDSMV